MKWLLRIQSLIGQEPNPCTSAAYRSDANRDRINGTSPSALHRRRCRRTPLGPSGRATAHRAVTAFEREDGHGAGASNCAKYISLNHRCARIQRHFISLADNFLQSFSLHLQFHLRITFEDLRVPLAKQPCHPLGGYAARTEASGIRGSQIVNPKVRNLCSSEGLLPNGLQLYLVSSRIQIAGNRNGPSPAIDN